MTLSRHDVIRVRVVVAAAALLGSIGCQQTGSTEPASSLAAGQEEADDRVAAVEAIPQILPAETLQKYKAALPKVAFGKLSAILADPETFWYDHESMPSSYQDSVEPSATVGCRRNDSGASLIDIIPGGRQVFNAAGTTFNFPFGHTAGTDNSTNAHIVDFMWLPKVQGKRLPVAYYIKNGKRGGFTLRQWRWMFPKGTVFGEMIFVKGEGGELLPVELRTRERYIGGWATNSYRPYPTASSLAAAIKELRPSWESNDALKRAVEHLSDNSTLQSKTAKSSVFPGIFEETGGIDSLPDLGDVGLVRDLMKREFVSSYGAVWKSGSGLKSFAASTTSKFSVVPNNFEASLIEVRDVSCQRCHKDAQKAIKDFNENAVLYGDIWGSDQIFSFHPFDPKLCRGAADDNRELRPIFKSSGLVQTYDASLHTADYYKELP